MPPRRRDSAEGGDDEERERPHGRGRERQAFLDYLARRWIGSDPPTAEAYARAERLWRQLPGAVITRPSALGTEESGPTEETGLTEDEGTGEP